MNKQMDTREGIEVKLRFEFHGENLSWQDIKVSWTGLVDTGNRNVLQDILAAVAAAGEVGTTGHVTAIRWNVQGSLQGHFSDVQA